MSTLLSRKLSVLACTWNVGNETPTLLDDIFNVVPKVESLDVIVLGFQESTFVVSGSTDPMGLDSIPYLKSILISKLEGDFILLEHNCRAQMQLYVFINKTLIPKDMMDAISSTNVHLHPILKDFFKVEKNAENTGFLQVFPNKGGILVVLKIIDTHIAIISCHLAAHEGVSKCALRNESIRAILSGIRVRDKRYDITSQVHHIIFMGDMNYRLTFDANFPGCQGVACDEVEIDIKDNNNCAEIIVENEVKCVSLSTLKKRSKEMNQLYSWIGSNNFQEMLKKDELNREINASRVLNGFTALMPDFPPTFKRIRGRSIPWKSDVSQWDCQYSERNLEPYLDLKKKNQLKASLTSLAAATIKSMADASNQFTSSVKSMTSQGKQANSTDINNDEDNEDRMSLMTLDDMKSSDNDGGVNDSANLASTALQSPNDVMRFYDLKRFPAYTDRILLKSFPKFQSDCVVKKFCSVESMTSSDHKPVIALLDITCRKFRFQDEVQYLQTLASFSGASDEYHDLDHISSTNTSPRTDRRSYFGYRPQSLAAHNFERHEKHPYMKCRLSHLRGHQLEELDSQLTGGLSDPYIILTCDPSELFTAGRLTTLSQNGSWEQFSCYDWLVDHCNCMNLSSKTAHEMRSSIIMHDINPQWNDVMYFSLMTSDILALNQHCHIILHVWDFDRTNEDDLIGSVLIPFESVFLHAMKSQEPYQFRLPLLYQGDHRGEISGQLEINLGVSKNNNTMERFSISRSSSAK